MKICGIAVIVTLIFCPLSAYAEKISLKDCMEKAALGNTVLKVQEYNQKIAEEDIYIAKSAYMPRMDAMAAYTVQNEAQSINFAQMNLDMQNQNYGSGNIAITQIICDFGRTDARREKAEAVRDAAGLSYKGMEQDVFLKVVEIYYGILESGKIMKAATEEVTQMETHLRMAKALYEQGVATRNDVLQAEVQLAGSRQRCLSAENTRENRWLLLNHITGADTKFRADLQEDNPEFLQKNMEEVFSASGRAEVKAMKKMIEAADSGVDEARSFYRPEIFGKLQTDYLENSHYKEQAILSATVGIKINIFDGFATTSKSAQAIKSRARAEAAFNEVEEKTRLEYQLALNDMHLSEQKINNISKAVRQGEENLRINQNRYQEHVGTATNVIDAQTLLTRTKTDYYRAIFEKEVAVARIKRAAGEL